MNKNQKQVKEFMLAAGQDCPDLPHVPDYKTRELRVRLLLEEVLELAEASGVEVSAGESGALSHSDQLHYKDSGRVDLKEVADAICDIDYVNCGAALSFGLDIEPFFEEVQRSNMSKFIDGHEDPDTGKWIKGPSYSKADLGPILETQKKVGSMDEQTAYLFGIAKLTKLIR